MRIFYSFLIIFCSVILWLLPVSQGIYDFETDLKLDNLYATTAVGTTNSTIQLTSDIYDDDTGTLSISSNDSDDVPAIYSYNATTRALVVTGLADNTTRTISATYDVDAIEGPEAIGDFFEIFPFLWIVIISVFPVAGLTAIWMGRA